MILSGDRYNWGHNLKPRTAKSGYTPAVGDLVVMDTGAACSVDLIAANEATYGVVEVVGADGVLTVAELLPGTEIELPTHGTVNLGDKVEFYSNTRPTSTSVQRTVVQTDNSNGAGSVIAVDADCPHGTGHATVRF